MTSENAGAHRRRNPLADRWVLVSPHRLLRPWSGAVEAPASVAVPPHDPGCALCPRVVRQNGSTNPDYPGTFVFDNDFGALLPTVDKHAPASGPPGLFEAVPERGLCRVICFSPRHDASLATMSAPAVRAVIDTWCAQLEELRALPFIEHVQIFENRGAAMGASNMHPHGQVWAQAHVPSDVETETRTQRAHQQRTGRCLVCDVLEAERSAQERVVVENARWTAFVPFWAAWPFETMLAPRGHRAHLTALDDDDKADLADILGRLFRAYDRLFATPMPLTWGFHGAPAQASADDAEAWHLHAHVMPPLLRSASVRKWMVGYEMLAEAQRDLTPEDAAARLRSVAAEP